MIYAVINRYVGILRRIVAHAKNHWPTVGSNFTFSNTVTDATNIKTHEPKFESAIAI